MPEDVHAIFGIVLALVVILGAIMTAERLVKRRDQPMRRTLVRLTSVGFVLIAFTIMFSVVLLIDWISSS